jgi:hypothetical protein
VDVEEEDVEEEEDAEGVEDVEEDLESFMLL